VCGLVLAPCKKVLFGVRRTSNSFTHHQSPTQRSLFQNVFFAAMSHGSEFRNKSSYRGFGRKWHFSEASSSLQEERCGFFFNRPPQLASAGGRFRANFEFQSNPLTCAAAGANDSLGGFPWSVRRSILVRRSLRADQPKAPDEQFFAPRSPAPRPFSIADGAGIPGGIKPKASVPNLLKSPQGDSIQYRQDSI